jgi:hypothetical protein
VTGSFDPAAELGELERQLARLGERLALPPETLLAEAPEVSGWSTAAHVFHAVLACDLSLGNAAALARDAGKLVRGPQERRDEAQVILRAGSIPRGEAEAPRFVTPPARIDLDLARQLLEEVEGKRAGLAADLDALRAAPRTIPHQLLGDLTGPEWVRFARVHTDHHLVIVDEVLAALG